MKEEHNMVANSSDMKLSVMYIGYLILKEIQRQNVTCVSIYDIAKALKSEGIRNNRQMVLGLSFLYSVNIIEFEEAMVWIKQ